MSPLERRNNRHLGIAGCILCIALVGSLFFPPLLVATIAMVSYLMMDMYQQTFHSLFYEKRLTMGLLVSLYLTGFWLAGYYVFGGLVFILAFFGNKILFQMEGRSRENLTNLFGQQPREVWRLSDGIEIACPFDQLQAGKVTSFPRLREYFSTPPLGKGEVGREDLLPYNGVK